MKLNPNYIVHKTETETVLVPLGGSPFTGIGRGNATLGELLSLLEQEITEEDLIAADVRNVLAQLREIGAIDG